MEAKRLIAESWTVDVLAEADHEFARDFLNGLKARRPAVYKKLFRQLEHAARYGPPRNEQKYRQIKGIPGQLGEFKANDARILCFFDGARRIVLTHGFEKGPPKTQQTEIRRGLQLRDAYLLDKAARKRFGR